VTICRSCGKELPAGDFPFCPFCTAPLERAPASREQRKIVTVLFCDVTGSTALGESSDPEALRALLARYFERMKGIVESHGGTVEKFIGDAVMAVFGVPIAHEDDALRAVRAAAEMRDALPALGVEARIGLNTGEVVTGTQERLATGDAVNVAARLEQAAQPGEILIGQETLRLVRDGVEAEPCGQLELKGKSEPVPAFRLAAVSGTLDRRHEARFVGRSQEVEMLVQAWQRAREEEQCEFVTVIGEPGVGKSRLAAEFLDGMQARSVHGRCLSYGEGMTYWPIVEVLKQLGALPSDPAAAAAVRSLLRESDEATSADEIAWAFWKLLEEQAARQPLVCVFDDIQWGEETFLDLIEHVAKRLRGAGILLLCLARPELVERRPQWPGRLLLEPLAADDVAELIPETMADDLRERISRAGGGNPLFVTEMVAMAREANGSVVVPPTLQAVLAARLDQLEYPERSVLERGAVEGEIFHGDAVQALAPEEPQVATRLSALVARGLIRPDAPQFPGEDGFRFRHLLLRDVAYDGLAKAARAELHQRFAVWVDQKVDLVELDEIVGYHLEQAARYNADLGRFDATLAARAGERLAAAGRRALWLGDTLAAAPLLERALGLTRPLRLDVHLELDLSEAHQVQAEQAAIAEEVAERAREAGDHVGEALARVVAAYARSLVVEDPPIDELERLARSALPPLEQAEDHAGLARVWFVLGASVATYYGRFEDYAEAAEEALRRFELWGRPAHGLAGLPSALVHGPRPANEALRTLDAVLPPNPDPWVLLRRGQLLAMLGRFEEAWALALPAAERWHELSGDPWGDSYLAEIAAIAGDHTSVVGYLRRVNDLYELRGSRAWLSTTAPALGRSLCVLARFDEAEPLADLGRELGGKRDLATQMLWRQVQARVHAHRGERAEAERLAHEAVALADRTDSLNWQGDARSDLAEVLAAAGRAEAAQAFEQALERYECKENFAAAAQVRPRLQELRAAVT
jgi:class 3 adenylate cyclase